MVEIEERKENIMVNFESVIGKAIKDGKLCCICYSKISDYGNNPYPVIKEEGMRCCDSCNTMYVIPARLKQLGIG